MRVELDEELNPEIMTGAKIKGQRLSGLRHQYEQYEDYFELKAVENQQMQEELSVPSAPPPFLSCLK